MFHTTANLKALQLLLVLGGLAQAVPVAAESQPFESDSGPFPPIVLYATPPEKGFIFLKQPGKSIHVKIRLDQNRLEERLDETIVKTFAGSYVWQKVKITEFPSGEVFVGWQYWGLARKPGEMIPVAFEPRSLPNLTVINCIIVFAPFVSYYIGIFIRKIVLPGVNSPPLMHQFLLGIPMSLLVVSPLLPVIDKTVTDLAPFLVTMGIIMEHGMIVNETATYQLGKLRRALSDGPGRTTKANPKQNPKDQLSS